MRRGSIWLLSGVLLIACPTQAPVRPSHEPLPAPSAEAPPPAADPEPDAAAPDAAADASTKPDAPPAAPPVGSTAEYFRCGSSKCKAGSETCCGAGKAGVCVPSSPYDEPQGKPGYFKTQFEVCDKETVAKTGFSMSHVDRCDESIDCGKGEVCCDQFLFSGGTLGECTKLPPGGATPCDYGERCIESSTCKLPGSVCVEGYCRKPVPNLACGGAPCSGTTPVCCGDPLGCQSKCEDYKRILCAKRSDCLAGQDCVMTSYGTQCIRLYVPGAMQPLCARDGDCKRACADDPRKWTRCKPSDVPWLETCQCP